MSSLASVEQSPPGLVLSDITCKCCKHDCSQSPVSHWQGTSSRGRVHGVDDMITMTVMMTVNVLLMTGVVLSLSFFHWSLVNTYGRVLPKLFDKNDGMLKTKKTRSRAS